MVEEMVTGRVGVPGERVRELERVGAQEARPATSGLPTLPLATTLAAAAALAACGGGSSGGGSGSVTAAGTTGDGAGTLSPLAGTSTAQTYVYTKPQNDTEAARFLLQAQFSASEADIASVTAKGYLPWLGEQFDAAPTLTGWAWIAARPTTRSTPTG